MSEAETPPREAEKHPYWNYRDVLVLAALAVPLRFLTVGLVAVLSLATGWKPAAQALPVLAAQFLFYLLWLACLYVWIKVQYGQPFWPSMAWVRPPKGWWNSFAWGILTWIAVIVLGALLKPPRIEMPLEELLRDRVSLVGVGLFAVTLGPLWEELAFRGFLLPLLVRSLTVVPAVLLTALLFAGLHGPEYAWSWKHLALVAVAGSAFGGMRCWSGSTAAAAVMHAGYNLAIFAGTALPRFAP